MKKLFRFFARKGKPKEPLAVLPRAGFGGGSRTAAATTDDIFSNPLHPLNPLSPINHLQSAPAPCPVHEATVTSRDWSNGDSYSSCDSSSYSSSDSCSYSSSDSGSSGYSD